MIIIIIIIIIIIVIIIILIIRVTVPTIFLKISGKSLNFRKKSNNLYESKICEGVLCAITFRCKEFLTF